MLYIIYSITPFETHDIVYYNFTQTSVTLILIFCSFFIFPGFSVIKGILYSLLLCEYNFSIDNQSVNNRKWKNYDFLLWNQEHCLKICPQLCILTRFYVLLRNVKCTSHTNWRFRTDYEYLAIIWIFVNDIFEKSFIDLRRLWVGWDYYYVLTER